MKIQLAVATVAALLSSVNAAVSPLANFAAETADVENVGERKRGHASKRERQGGAVSIAALLALLDARENFQVEEIETPETTALNAARKSPARDLIQRPSSTSTTRPVVSPGFLRTKTLNTTFKRLHCRATSPFGGELEGPGIISFTKHLRGSQDGVQGYHKAPRAHSPGGVLGILGEQLECAPEGIFFTRHFINCVNYGRPQSLEFLVLPDGPGDPGNSAVREILPDLTPVP
ncbi:hypothetical protein THAOC_01871 [Thalassiosira oceanica]|uniref:PPIase cyclophilin-type domain-containing protein n=1 Tax=Thalassiosira oceanica TaxID=159749 RepID=K0TH76_THAOC|nr:hypothetical protein THAOC_01871 [Thalassiosira oceanica]|eukprot:EJK76369.1 hypothetical protein THAOC_01871 [Thalassiosira oceanica]